MTDIIDPHGVIIIRQLHICDGAPTGFLCFVQGHTDM